MRKVEYFIGNKFYRTIPILVLSFMGIIILLTIVGLSSAVYTMSPNQQSLVLDSGSGKSNQAATVEGSPERELSLAVTRWLKEYLASSGITVIMTKEEGNDYLSLKQQEKAKICVRLLVNSTVGGNRSGAETFYQEGTQEGKLLAQQIHGELQQLKNIKHGAIHASGFKQVEEVQIPTVIIQFSYNSDSALKEALKQPGYQKQLAQSIAKGVNNYLALGAKTGQ